MAHFLFPFVRMCRYQKETSEIIFANFHVTHFYTSLYQFIFLLTSQLALMFRSKVLFALSCSALHVFLFFTRITCLQYFRKKSLSVYLCVCSSVYFGDLEGLRVYALQPTGRGQTLKRCNTSKINDTFFSLKPPDCWLFSSSTW